jgi:hypothetical protein
VEFDRTRGAGEGEGELTDDQTSYHYSFFLNELGLSSILKRRRSLDGHYTTTLIYNNYKKRKKRKGVH